MLSRLQRLPLGVRLGLACALVEAILIAVLAVAGVAILERRLNEQSQLHLAAVSEMLQLAMTEPLVRKDYGQLADVARRTRALGGVTYVVIEDFTGRTLVAEGWPSSLDTPEPRPIDAADKHIHLRTDLTVFGQRYGQIRYGISLQFLRDSRAELIRLFLFAGSAMVLLSTGLFAAIGYVLSQRLALLTHSAESIAAGNLLAPIPIGTADDVGRLGAAFARMADALHKRLEELGASEERFRRAFTDSPIGMALITDEGRWLKVNQTLASMIGARDSDLIDHDLSTLVVPDDCAALMAWITGSDRHTPYQTEVRLRRRDGTPCLASITASLIPVNDRTSLVVVHIQDITQRRRAEEERRLYGTVFENSVEGILVTDANGLVLSINPAFSSITGYTLDEIRGQRPSLLQSGRHDRQFYQEMWHSITTLGSWQGEVWDRRKSGEVIPLWLGISAVRNTDGTLTHLVGISTDVSESKAAEERIQFLAHHDPLTGLPNRVLLHDRVERALLHGSRNRTKVALLSLDLDRFKTINDSLGHPIGDLLLQVVAARLQLCLGDADTVSRQGGDEFVLLLGDLHDTDAVTRVVGRIRDRLANPIEVDGHPLTVSVSCGISLYPDDGEDFDTLLKKADLALFKAKADGRNTACYFTESMDEEARERLTIESRLRRAIDRGEFLLHYQPQVSLPARRLIGVEALIRWNSAELGFQSPQRFISIAEESGLIVPIGEWVLEEACRQTKMWSEQSDVRLVTAVNVSSVQFQRTDMAETARRAIDSTGVDPSCIEFELTESVLLGEEDKMARTLTRLRDLGVRLAIDDFGTGYSSLSYLKRLPVDRLKIDRSFVNDLLTNLDDAAIVRAMIQLGHTLRQKVIAEGVETEAQVRYLVSQGCDEAQGYYFGRPGLPGAITALLTQIRTEAETEVPPRVARGGR